MNFKVGDICYFQHYGGYVIFLVGNIKSGRYTKFRKTDLVVYNCFWTNTDYFDDNSTLSDNLVVINKYPFVVPLNDFVLTQEFVENWRLLYDE